MMTTYNLAAVAEAMDLSQGAVKRLGQMLGVPQQAFGQRPLSGLRIYRYTQADMEQLKTAQALLVAGKSFAQIQSLVKATQPERPQRAQETSPSCADENFLLQSYESSPALKAQMAEETMEAYQAQRHIRQNAPLKSLAKAMAHPLRPISPLPHFNVRPAYPPLVAAPEAPMASAWISNELRRQAVALKRQLVAQS